MSQAFVLTPAIKAVIAESSRRIFGHLPVVPYRTGNKIWKQKPIGPIMASHYLHDLKSDFTKISKDYETEIEERRSQVLDRLKRDGRGPPKKGEGKRSKKSKK